MASLNLESFGDLVALQVKDYIRTDYVSLLTDDVDHPFAKQMLRKHRMDRGQGGTTVYWKVRMGTAGSYRHISPTTPDRPTMSDDFQEASEPYRKVEVGWSFLEEQIDFNMGPDRIVDLVKAKEQGADFDFIDGIEQDAWAFPSASDTLAFRSIPYWFPKNATEGFNGGIPTGYSDVAGLSPTTWPRWNSYTGQYTAVTIDDLVRKLRTMATKTGFTPPVANVPDLGKTGPNKGYYTNLSVQMAWADIADSRNDNIGPDVARFDGEETFRRAPINYVPALDADTTNPLYQIPWDVFKILIRPKWWQKRTTLKPYPGQRNQVASFKDTYMNMVCFNRRLGGVLATGTTYPS